MTTPMREKMIRASKKQRRYLRGRDPREIALRCGAEFENGDLTASSTTTSIPSPFPDLQVRLDATGKPCGLNRSSMFYYYLLMQTVALDGKVGRYRFRDLPGGMFYHQAYQGYSGDRLAKAIDNHSSYLSELRERSGWSSSPSETPRIRSMSTACKSRGGLLFGRRRFSCYGECSF